MEKKRFGMWIGKALLLAVLFTALLLFLLALLLYKSALPMNTAETLLLLAYLGAPFLGAFYLGKKVRERRYLWGLLIGVCYFLLFLAVSLLTGGFENMDGMVLLRVFFMAAAGGGLGGMLS